MRRSASALVLVASLASLGCFHATVNTQLPPNGRTIDRPWAHGFVYGLVPPSTVESESQCSDGVARVETKHSFLNMLAYIATGGLYSPMTITVQCGGVTGADERSGSAADVPLGGGQMIHATRRE